MFNELFQLIDTLVLNNISNLVGVFSNTITPLIGACVVLYALYLAWQSLYDAENMMIMESMKFIGSLALCTTIAFSTSWYLKSIVPMILYSGDEIASILLGSSGVGAVQHMFDSIFDLVEKTYDSIDIDVLNGDSWLSAIMKLIICGLITVGGLVFIAIATAYLMVAKIMVGFLLIIGPLFIMFAFFPSTRSMFQSWTGQCLNYTLLSILFPVAFNMFNVAIKTVVLDNDVSLFVACLIFVCFFVFCVLSVQIPTFCSSITGGVGINGLVGNMGAGARTMGAAGKAAGKYSGANAAGRWAGNKARTGAKNLLDKAKNNIKPG
ncbi:type IV secretion system protein [Vibrio sp. ArtGut-C1]|uniref:type IV secretion system protein n=1 Tax=Vibrio sp. ArtGut-C1 TaxID=2259137 RepID=UPI000A18DD29|nr:type IV secretion system protein [Vibrio sp. ArtGut-C1]